jgi:dihydrofolate synthase/folylpolyglutamate synthase
VKNCPVSKDCSQFEITFAIALLWFLQESCELVILETGIGGLLDATNIVKHPLACAITSVSFDHMAILGNSLTQIATQKAGIIKPGCPVVLAPDNTMEVVQLVKETASRKNAAFVVPSFQDCHILSETMEETVFQYHCFTYTLHMPGRHQVYNALTAIEIIRILGMHGYLISAEMTQQAFAQVHVPARTQILQRSPLVILDGSHNQAGVMALTDLLRRTDVAPVHGICGMMHHKDYSTACGILCQTLDTVVCVDDFSEQAVDAAVLADCFHRCASVTTNTLHNAYTIATEQAKKDGGMVVICGSLYLASKVLQELFPDNKPVL